MKNINKIVITAMILISTLSCAPTLEVSEYTPPTKWSTTAYNSNTPSKEWWESFADSTLNLLIEQALSENRDLLAAVERVESARNMIRTNRAAYLPTLSVALTADVEKTEWEGRVEEYYAEPTISWELPLFGALRSTNRKSRAEAISSEWALRGVELTLTCEVATTYFKLQKARANLSIAQESYTLRREESTLIDSMYRYGMSSLVDLRQSQSLVYSAEVDIEAYKTEIVALECSLATLIGETPQVTQSWSAGISEVEPLSISPPQSTPSNVLERRWDVQQSWQEVESAAASVGLARAARFPTLSITSAAGVASETIKGLTSGKPWAWSVAATLTEPIYNFGGLRSRERSARCEYRAALWEYEQSMLQAISEVEQQLVAIENDRRERIVNKQLVEANREIRNSTGALYTNGMESYLDVIDAERSLYASEQSLVESIIAERLSYISLIKALGGGI